MNLSVSSSGRSDVHWVGEPDQPTPNPISEPFLLATFVRDQPTAARWLPHQHDVVELVWAISGVVNINVGGIVHVLRPSLGVLIPAGQVHDSVVVQSARIGTTYLRTLAIARPTQVRVGRALEEMLLHLNNVPMGDAERLRAQQVCIDMMQSFPLHDPSVPVPDDPRIRSIVRAILSDPADDRSLEQWSTITATSIATIMRAFADSAGMSFAQWRRIVRVKASISLLIDGVAVAAAGRRVGYHSSSAFIAAFRQVMGTTPRAFIRKREDARLD